MRVARRRESSTIAVVVGLTSAAAGSSICYSARSDSLAPRGVEPHHLLPNRERPVLARPSAPDVHTCIINSADLLPLSRLVPIGGRGGDLTKWRSWHPYSLPG